MGQGRYFCDYIIIVMVVCVDEWLLEKENEIVVSLWEVVGLILNCEWKEEK